VQSARVPWFCGVEQRDRDDAGVQRAVERHHVVQPLRSKDGDAIAWLGDLLQAGADGAVARTELRPGQVVVDAVALSREIKVTIGQTIPAHLGPSLNVADEAGVFGEFDPPSLLIDKRAGYWHVNSFVSV
jgi:hypothetical protein